MNFTRKEFELLLQSVGCGIFTVDTGYRITSWNRAAEEITGRVSSQMIGRKLDSLLEQ